MYICVCEQVTEKQIVTAIKNGAASVGDLSHELGVSSQCGQCENCVKTLLSKHADPLVTRLITPKQRTIPIEFFC